MTVRLQIDAAEYTDRIATRLKTWAEDSVLERMWQKDHTVWSEEPVAELTDRLGWLALPEELEAKLSDLTAFGNELRELGATHVVVLGMGGSSLAPEVYAKTFGRGDGMPELLVLDSTHPDAVRAVAEDIELASSVFIVASKSGTTIEPLSFMEYFWERITQITDTPGDHFVATTDPGSKLAAIAAERGFRRVFLANPEVGGRYSALTEFGMVPAAAIGADLGAMYASAREQQVAHGAEAVVATTPGCRLGAAVGEWALSGRDKLTFFASPALGALPAWIEQLIAESTGKEGIGIVPVVGESDRDDYGDDRAFVALQVAGDSLELPAAAAGHPVAGLTLDSADDIGGAMYIFEVATALAGAALGIQPFDQPDVQIAKELAKSAMEGKLDASQVKPHDVADPALGDAIADWLETAGPGDYIGVHAFIAPTEAARSVLENVRQTLGSSSGLATTLDFGPRFLHSTGQLHKGGPNTGLFLEVVDTAQADLSVPSTDYSFGELILGQALGDHMALRERDRRVLLVDIGDRGVAGLHMLADSMSRDT